MSTSSPVQRAEATDEQIDELAAVLIDIYDRAAGPGETTTFAAEAQSILESDWLAAHDADLVRVRNERIADLEARLSSIHQAWMDSFMGPNVLTKEFAERVQPIMQQMRSESRAALSGGVPDGE